MTTGTDSGGTPWAGRELPAGPFAGDDGRPDTALTDALSGQGDTVDEPPPGPGVVQALRTARVFVPVVASAEDAAEMALVTITGVDGRRALPVFTSPATLARWRPDARPVPVPAPRAALSAVQEGCDLIDVDPAGPRPYQVPRPAVWAIAQGVGWVPSYDDAEVADEISGICVALGLRSRCERGTTAELRIVLGLPTGLDPDGVEDVVGRVSGALSRSDLVAARVDSLELRVVPL